MVLPVSAPARSRRFAVTRVASLSAMRADWTSIADGQDNIFSTWEWASAWWRVYGGSRKLFLHRVTDDRGKSVGILPLYVSSGALGTLVRFIGHGPGDQLGPVCRPEHRPEVAATMRVLLEASASPRFLLAERLRGDEGWMENLDSQVLQRVAFPLVRFEGRDWDAWLASKSGNFRQQARRRERRLAREHRLEYRLVSEAHEVPEALEALFALHDARWGDRSNAFDAGRRAFHREFTRDAAAHGWLRIWMAYVDGRVAAVWLGYRFGDVESYYQMGRDPSWNDYNLGFVLLMHTIREAANDGVREYRLLAGGEQYKDRIASHDPGLETCVVGRPAVKRLASDLARHRHRLPALARRASAARLGW